MNLIGIVYFPILMIKAPLLRDNAWDEKQWWSGQEDEHRQEQAFNATSLTLQDAKPGRAHAIGTDTARWCL